MPSLYKCSKCGATLYYSEEVKLPVLPNVCPNCGRKIPENWKETCRIEIVQLLKPKNRRTTPPGPRISAYRLTQNVQNKLLSLGYTLTCYFCHETLKLGDLIVSRLSRTSGGPLRRKFYHYECAKKARVI